MSPTKADRLAALQGRRRQNAISADKYYTRSELGAFLAALGRWIDDGRGTKYHRSRVRWGLYFRLLIETGARVAEGLNVRAKDLALDPGLSVWIYGLKGSNDRELPIPEGLSQELHSLADRVADHGQLFPFATSTAQRAFLEVIERAPEISSKGLKGFRHSYAVLTWKALADKDILVLKYLMGHKAIQNTLIYVEADVMEGRMVEVLEAREGILLGAG